MNFKVSQILVLIFALYGIAQASSNSSVENLQEFYNGFFERVFLPDPTTVMSCYNETSANLTLNFLGEFIGELLNNKVINVAQTVRTYLKHLPPEVSQCLSQNQELQTAYEKYHIQNKTLEQIAVQTAKFAALHYLQYHDTLIDLNDVFQAGNFYETGRLVGELIQDVFKSEQNTVADIMDELKKKFSDLI